MSVLDAPHSLGSDRGEPAAGSSLLRLATAGSVDDGKSTLIGRLLYDAKSIFEDQLAAVEESSRRRGHEGTNLALLTDGLRAEREQGITIDVAYRYFATPKRTFILADTPGHVQYTRNMVTGASTADVALVLVDARNGLVEQSRRHLALAGLLRVPHVILCVNKMDLVGWSKERFDEIRIAFASLADQLDVVDPIAIPLSALNGDNVVDRSVLPEAAWYDGPALLELLEAIELEDDLPLAAVRFPVQYVIRPQTAERPDYRAYAGKLEGGILRPGDRVVHLPSGRETTVAGIDTFDGPLEEALPPLSISVRLTDDIDISRGDMLCHVDDAPEPVQDLQATICWLAEGPGLRPGQKLALKHTTRSVRTIVKDIVHRLDVESLTIEKDVEVLTLNDIAVVNLRTTQPLFADSYVQNRATGSFLLIDEATGATVAAGMLK